MAWVTTFRHCCSLNIITVVLTKTWVNEQFNILGVNCFSMHFQVYVENLDLQYQLQRARSLLHPKRPPPLSLRLKHFFQSPLGLGSESNFLVRPNTFQSLIWVYSLFVPGLVSSILWSTRLCPFLCLFVCLSFFPLANLENRSLICTKFSVYNLRSRSWSDDRVWYVIYFRMM